MGRKSREQKKNFFFEMRLNADYTRLPSGDPVPKIMKREHDNMPPLTNHASLTGLEQLLSNELLRSPFKPNYTS
jgi:hypothetical protein